MPTPKPLTRAQQKENAAFLRHLRRTGNACAAARALGLKRDRFNQRRLKHPAFAAKWEAMLALAHAELVPVRGEGPAPAALDRARFDAISRRVNGGNHGINERWSAYQRALAALAPQQ